MFSLAYSTLKIADGVADLSVMMTVCVVPMLHASGPTSDANEKRRKRSVHLHHSSEETLQSLGSNGTRTSTHTADVLVLAYCLVLSCFVVNLLLLSLILFNSETSAAN